MPTFDEPLEIDGQDLIMRQDGVVHVQIDVSKSDIKLGGGGSNGEVHLHDGEGNLLAVVSPTWMRLSNIAGGQTVYIDADKSESTFGGDGADGVIYLYDAAGNRLTVLAPTFAAWRSTQDYETVRIDGELGDIILSGADCAELFDVGDADAREPGTVLVVDDHERLWPCHREYDRRVAGIVSGGNGLKPGVILGGYRSQKAGVPLALSGKAYCKVDAKFGAITVGDLLTTSPTPGHAMNASDPGQAFGAVIGKALGSHADGLGMIPVLVSLQ